MHTDKHISSSSGRIAIGSEKLGRINETFASETDEESQHAMTASQWNHMHQSNWSHVHQVPIMNPLDAKRYRMHQSHHQVPYPHLHNVPITMETNDSREPKNGKKKKSAVGKRAEGFGLSGSPTNNDKPGPSRQLFY